MTTRRPKLSLARKIPPPTGEYRWVYLWEWPIRAMHWVAVACLISLTLTGLYIGKPYFMTGGEASSHFLMGRVRFVHFASAAVLVMTGIIRFYWLFMKPLRTHGALFPCGGGMKNWSDGQVLPDDQTGTGAEIPGT
jgi:Ni,Fe-hydrogenase I cytochrome b subunit